MATFKFVFRINGPGSDTFTEVYYREAGNLAATTISQGFINRRAALLDPSYTIQACKISQVGALRITRPAPIGRQGNWATVGAASGEGPNVGGLAAVIQLTGLGGGSRKLWLRGTPDNAVQRGPLTGQDILIPRYLDYVNQYIQRLSTDGYGILRRTPVGVGGVVQQGVIAIDGVTSPGQSVLTLDGPHTLVKGSRIVIALASKKDYPALNGTYTVLSAATPKVTIAYRVPTGNTGPIAPAYVKQYIPLATDVIDPTFSEFAYLGVRKTQKSFTSSRGSRRGARLRNSP